jgi:hypothetical protein
MKIKFAILIVLLLTQKSYAQLDMALAMSQIKEREENYRSQGILPPQKPSSIVIDGNIYPSYGYFSSTEAGQSWIALQQAKNTWKDQKAKIDAEYYAKIRKESFQEIVQLEKLPWNERQRILTRKRIERDRKIEKEIEFRKIESS